MAAAYIAALTGSAETPCTWQYFDDLPAPLLANGKRGSKRPSKAKHFYATLAEAAVRLTRANADRCGVFVTVNETDGLGREASNITRIRAVFIDCDGFTPPAWHLPPSIVVQSRNGPHAYWLVDDCPILDFSDAQRRLAQHYGSDSKVSDPSRVLRVPGFWHCKTDPYMVTLK